MEAAPDATNVLVTGGTGVVGRSLVRRLAAAGLSVRVLSRSTRTTNQPNVSICHGDVLRLEDVRAALHGCDAVFHCAGEKNDPSTMAAVNVAATKLVFDLARDLRLKFFCHLSTVGVIGKVATTLVDESTPCHPMNFYEETKLSAEKIVLAGLDTGRVAILRPTNVFTADTLGPMFEHSACAKAKLLLKGNQNSHLVYVEDVAAAAMFCMCTDLPGRVHTFIVSSDEEPGGTYREVHSLLASISDAAPPPDFVAPDWVRYWLRRLKGRAANRGNVVYSSRRLRAAGFDNPFGRVGGLRHALATLDGTLRRP